jgi:hypothetical protein
MGQAHFWKMLEDARVRDSRALITASIMRERVNPTVPAPEAEDNMWFDTPKDRLMALARVLDTINDRFLHRLTELTLEGSISPKCFNPYQGRLMNVRDERLFTYDIPRIPPEHFAEALLEF